MLNYKYQSEYEWHPLYKYVMMVKSLYMGCSPDSCSYNFEEWFNTVKDNFYDEDGVITSLSNIFAPLDMTIYKHYVLFKYKGYIELSDMGYGGDFFELYNGLYRECRSIVFDVKNDTIELASLAKFKNYGEDEGSWSADNIKDKYGSAIKVFITNKMDGSYQQYRYDEKEDEVIGSGSSALDREESWRLTDGYRLLSSNYKRMLKDYPDYTFIFEYISPKNPIVVKYTADQEGLYLLAARDTKTGKEMDYTSLLCFASWYGVKITDSYEETLESILKATKDYTSDEKEGWVIDMININDSHFRVKIKTDDYVLLHKALSNMVSPNAVIQALSEGKYDDFIAKVPVAYIELIEGYKNNILEYLQTLEYVTDWWYNLAEHSLTTAFKNNDRKKIMVWIDAYVPKFLISRVKNIYLGKSNSGLLRKGFCYKYAEIMKNLTLVRKYKEDIDSGKIFLRGLDKEN